MNHVFPDVPQSQLMLIITVVFPLVKTLESIPLRWPPPGKISSNSLFTSARILWLFGQRELLHFLIEDALPEGVQETHALVVVVRGLSDAIEQVERFLRAHRLASSSSSSSGTGSGSGSAHCFSRSRLILRLRGC